MPGISEVFATRELAGVSVPESPLISATLDYAKQLYEPFLFNHAIRSWLFAARIGQLKGIDCDLGVFHDLGIWTNGTFDYIAPSVALARDYLVDGAREDWTAEIEAMIADHHKITASTAEPDSLIETFRRADWIDVTCGLRRFGMPRRFVARLFAAWPSAGFHWRLVTLTLNRFRSHPLTPLPMVRL